MKPKIRIKNDSIVGRNTKICIVDDEGNELPIPGIYELQVKMTVDGLNEAEIKLRAFVEIDVIAELIKAEREQ